MYVPLHVRSMYSLGLGVASVDDLVDRAHALGYEAMALTDRHTVYGFVPFARACARVGIQPLYGCELSIQSARGGVEAYDVVVLARTAQGYAHVCALASCAVPIPWDVFALHVEGLVVLSGGVDGEVARCIAMERFDWAEDVVRQFVAVCPSFYIEAVHDGSLEAAVRVHALQTLAGRIGVSLVGTDVICCAVPEDAPLCRLLTAEDDASRQCAGALVSPQDMVERFRSCPEALAATLTIASLCHADVPFGTDGGLPAIVDGTHRLRTLCHEGCMRAYGADHASAQARLSEELAVIEALGFVDYFLIIHDIVQHAKRIGIGVGPGRGSVAGCLVAYVLGVTEIDPLRYGLLFERFLNASRATMPDIDIDIDDQRRGEVLAYIVQKYGAEHVALVGAIAVYGPRQALRHVGSRMRIAQQHIERMVALVPARTSLADARAHREAVRSWCASDARIDSWVQWASRLEVLPRHMSTHAAGVVISRTPVRSLTAVVPHTSPAVLQLTMGDLDAFGFVKMDVLGLRTLSILETACALSKQTSGVSPQWDQIGIDDQQTFDMLGQGLTFGVFQLEQVDRVLRTVQPTDVPALAAVMALCRPGPMAFVDQYVRTKNGLEPIHAPHPDIIDIVAPTYGVIVYQEQVMRIATRLARMTMQQADVLRAAVSKKNPQLMMAQRTAFLDGCVAHGVTWQQAEDVFAVIERFAGYGFPQAHATAYAMLAYRTAYMKAHDPVGWMCAVVTHRPETIVKAVAHCHVLGVVVLAPHINASVAQTMPERIAEGHAHRYAVRLGLQLVRGVGQRTIDAIVAEREAGGAYASFADFVHRFDWDTGSVQAVDALICAGAFDGCADGHRAQWQAVLPDVAKRAQKTRALRAVVRDASLGLLMQPNWTIALPEVPMLSQTEQLAQQRNVLGVYVSGHPLDAYAPFMRAHGIVSIHALGNVTLPVDIVCIGRVLAIKLLRTKTAKAMALLTIEDQCASLTVVALPAVWACIHDTVQRYAVKAWIGRLEERDHKVQLVVSHVMDVDDPNVTQRLAHRPALAQARPRTVPHARPRRSEPHTSAEPALWILLRAEDEAPGRVQRIANMLRRYPGSTRVYVRYARTQKVIALAPTYFVDVCAPLLRLLRGVLGDDAVVVR
jgi:DNA polymerase-3 subunit alpha